MPLTLQKVVIFLFEGNITLHIGIVKHENTICRVWPEKAIYREKRVKTQRRLKRALKKWHLTRRPHQWMSGVPAAESWRIITVDSRAH
jgi:hypothetical protein